MASWEIHHFYGGFGGKIIELFMGPMCRKAPTPQSPVSHQGSTARATLVGPCGAGGIA